MAGTLAVATFAFLSLDIPEVSARLGVAVVCALAEAFGTLANRTVYARTTEHTRVVAYQRPHLPNPVVIQVQI